MVLCCLFLFLISSSLFGQDEVKIGKHIWMTKNLDVDRFRNGDKIPEAKTKEEWLKAGSEGKPAWCYYNNKVDKANGRLYNYYAVIDPRGLAPTGWKVPNTNHVINLFDSSYYWYFQSTNWGKEPCKICNSSKFNALPSGWRSTNRDFEYRGECCFWWTTTEIDTNLVARFQVCSKSTGMYGTYKTGGLFVRCVKEEPANIIYEEIEPSKVNVGDYYGGGIVFHTWKDTKGISHGLIISINDIGVAPYVPTYRSNNNNKSITSSYGIVNTKLLSSYDTTYSCAAYRALNYESNGKTDWFIPSVDEALILDKNLENVNRKLKSLQYADEISGEYWTSSQKDIQSVRTFEIESTRVYDRYDYINHNLSNGIYSIKIDYQGLHSKAKVRPIREF